MTDTTQTPVWSGYERMVHTDRLCPAYRQPTPYRIQEPMIWGPDSYVQDQLDKGHLWVCLLCSPEYRTDWSHGSAGFAHLGIKPNPCTTQLRPAPAGQAPVQCPDCGSWVSIDRDGSMRIIGPELAAEIEAGQWTASRTDSEPDVVRTVEYYQGKVRITRPVTDHDSPMFGGSTEEYVSCPHGADRPIHTRREAARKCAERAAAAVVRERNYKAPDRCADHQFTGPEHDACAR